MAIAINCTLSGLCVEIGEMCADFARPSERGVACGLCLCVVACTTGGREPACEVPEYSSICEYMRHTAAETPASTALSPCRVWCPRAAGPQPAQSETHTCANRVMGTHRVFTLTANRHDARAAPRRALRAAAGSKAKSGDPRAARS